MRKWDCPVVGFDNGSAGVNESGTVQRKSLSSPKLFGTTPYSPTLTLHLVPSSATEFSVGNARGPRTNGAIVCVGVTVAQEDDEVAVRRREVAVVASFVEVANGLVKTEPVVVAANGDVAKLTCVAEAALLVTARGEPEVLLADGETVVVTCTVAVADPVVAPKLLVVSPTPTPPPPTLSTLALALLFPLITATAIPIPAPTATTPARIAQAHQTIPHHFFVVFFEEEGMGEAGRERSMYADL